MEGASMAWLKLLTLLLAICVIVSNSERKRRGSAKRDKTDLKNGGASSTSAKRNEKYFTVAEELRKKTRATFNDRTLISFNLSYIDRLTITSFMYNPTSRVSAWVDKLFGHRALYYLKTDYGNVTARIPSKSPLTPEEIDLRFRMFRDVFQLPSYAIQPACSFEALGFVLLRDEGPFNPEDRNIPFVGNAILALPERKTTIQCFYRPLFENWRSDNTNSKPNYWSLIFYCPAETPSQCDYLDWQVWNNRYYTGEKNENGEDLYVKEEGRAEEGIFKIRTPPFNDDQTAIWTAPFRARPLVARERFLFKNYSTPRSILEGMNDDPDVTGVNDTLIRSNQAVLAANAAAVAAAIQSSAANQGHLPLAACLIIPYTSTDTQKSIANGAMLLEWIRYHAQLGFKLIIYDRDGANEEHIYRSQYGAKQRIRVPKEGKLVYHPYTIRGLLDSSRKGMRYDNTDAGFDQNETDPRRSSFEAQGHDKVMTLTHCRFEAKAVYGRCRWLRAVEPCLLSPSPSPPPLDE